MKERTNSKKEKENVNIAVSPAINTAFTQMAIPTHQELLFARQCGRNIVNMPYASRVLKFDKRNINNMNSTNVTLEKDGYREICRQFSSPEFLLHIQVKEGTVFTSTQLQFIEEIQDITETPFLCAYEKSHQGTVIELENQIINTRAKFPKKEVIPALEVFTVLRRDKVLMLKKLGVEKCIVIYRNYLKHERAWNELMGMLEAAGIVKFVLGVQPRMRRSNKTTLMLAPLRYAANYVAHGLPWSGGKPTVRLLDGWIYKIPSIASNGATSYQGNNRIQIENRISQSKDKYYFSRVDALNEINALIPFIGNLSVQQIKSLLY